LGVSLTEKLRRNDYANQVIKAGLNYSGDLGSIPRNQVEGKALAKKQGIQPEVDDSDW
jgi:hypothetical protein